MKDVLFLLRPGFYEGQSGPYYCGDSVSVEGLLSFFPTLREQVDVRYIDFPRPRNGVVELLGAENQSVPVLVLASDRVNKAASVTLATHGTYRFINNEADIRRYLSAQYDVATPK